MNYLPIIIYNGRCCQAGEASCGLSREELLGRRGAFTTIRLHEGKAENYFCHIRRLHRHCACLKMPCPFVKESWIYELARANNALTGTFRLKIAAVKAEGKPEVFACLSPYTRSFLEPQRLLIYPHPAASLAVRIKSFSCFARVAIQGFARERGYDDAMALDENHRVLETAFANIFWVDRGRIFTPSQELPLLFGTTMEAVLQAASALSYEVVETRASVEEIPSSASLFVCNALQGIQPVACIASKRFSLSDELLHLLRKSLQSVIEAYSLDLRKYPRSLCISKKSPSLLS